MSRRELARQLGVSRQSLYYVPKKENRDWSLKTRIEEVLREHPSYGSRRLALHLKHFGKKVYVATVLDLYTRRVVGVAVALRKGVPLTMQALQGALLHEPHPTIFHSDNGKEYAAKVFVAVLEGFGYLISRSHPGCPWENGYQESFYDKFKVELGDPGRFKTLGELVAEIYRIIWVYNHTRIHSALKMAPVEYEKAHKNQLSTLPLSV